MSWLVEPLLPSALEDVRTLLGRACLHDEAAAVAAEKLFESGAYKQPAHPRCVRLDGALIGVAVTSGKWLRLLAVEPAHRGLGVGTALLTDAEQLCEGAELRALDQPGNYLAPGVDRCNLDTVAWLSRRGFADRGDNLSLEVSLVDNLRVSAKRAHSLAASAANTGYAIRPSTPADIPALTAWIVEELSDTWAETIARSVPRDDAAVFVAEHAGSPVAFAARDTNNRGLGWFGPAGTQLAHRGHGLGAALLVAVLAELQQQGHQTCVISWIGPREFYQRAVGIAGERRYAVMRKTL